MAFRELHRPPTNRKKLTEDQDDRLWQRQGPVVIPAAPLVTWVVSWMLPAPFGRPPGPKGTSRTRFWPSGLSLEGPQAPFGRRPGPQRHPKVGANMKPVTQN